MSIEYEEVAARARLRDEFAMAALSGIPMDHTSKPESMRKYAQAAYRMADVMLEVRNENR